LDCVRLSSSATGECKKSAKSHTEKSPHDLLPPRRRYSEIFNSRLATAPSQGSVARQSSDGHRSSLSPGGFGTLAANWLRRPEAPGRHPNAKTNSLLVFAGERGRALGGERVVREAAAALGPPVQ